jgi:hypothetical protein
MLDFFSVCISRLFLSKPRLVLLASQVCPLMYSPITHFGISKSQPTDGIREFCAREFESCENSLARLLSVSTQTD